MIQVMTCVAVYDLIVDSTGFSTRTTIDATERAMFIKFMSHGLIYGDNGCTQKKKHYLNFGFNWFLPCWLELAKVSFLCCHFVASDS